MKDILLEILWALERLNNRVNALEMDSEGRGDDSIAKDLDELRTKIEPLKDVRAGLVDHLVVGNRSHPAKIITEDVSRLLPGPPYPPCAFKPCPGVLLPVTRPSQAKKGDRIVLLEDGSVELLWICSHCFREVSAFCERK